MPEIAGHLRAVLTNAANPAGGWAYYAHKNSRIEPTAWALLALVESASNDREADATFLAPHLRFLASCQRADGLLVDLPGAPPNFTANGLTACVLAQLPSTRSGDLLQRLLNGLVTVKGVSVDAPDPRQNNKLQGWPWMPDTFSWAEPTAWCTLALKKLNAAAPRTAAARIDEANKLLVNRSCTTGGWNYGNASALGQDLRAYVPTTAIALMALQDHRTEPAVVRSLAYLEREGGSEPSAMALALTSLCLRIYDRPAADVAAIDEHLAADVERAERIGNLMALSMALYALSADQHGARAFRI